MTAEPIALDAVPTAVYRFYNSSHVLLYVGITDSPAVRWRDHAKKKPWWSQVAERTLAWHPDRKAAAAEESVAIQTEEPLYNVAGRPRERLPRNRNWRNWNSTKAKAIRIGEGDWRDYKVVCDAEDTDRTKDLNEHIRRRIKAFRRKNPNVPLPSDSAGPES